MTDTVSPTVDLVSWSPCPRFPTTLAPADTHGDIAIQVCAIDSAACVHALRFLTMGSRASMAMRWMVEGFQRPNTQPGVGRTTTRNLMGFKNGTSNLAPGTDELSKRVWVTPQDDEPDWAINGSYLVARTIRMFVERWDRTPLDEQEHIIGRTKRTGAPLDGSREEDAPNYHSDPQGAATPIDAHIRLANPRTPASAASRILRRPYSFSRGFDPPGSSTRACCFSRINVISSRASWPSSSVSTGNRSRNTSARPVEATSSRFRASWGRGASSGSRYSPEVQSWAAWLAGRLRENPMVGAMKISSTGIR